MGKFRTLKLASLLAIFVAMSCFNVSAFATSATGPERTVTVFNISYTFFSKVTKDETDVWAIGDVSAPDNVPVGYMGLNSRLYNSSGTLVKSSGIRYNDSSIAGMARSSGKYSVKGTYYSQAQVSLYNGDRYNTYTANASPNVQLSMIPEKSYEVNENGLTYGSDFYAESLEDSPDLIRVIGKNGIEGYVYSKDINLELTLDEVLDYINSGQSGYIVPVYTEDGITIVDTFEIGTED